MKALLWFLTALWFVGSWYWYVCPHKGVCPWGKKTTPEKVIEKAKTYAPLVFDWSKEGAITSDRFPAFRDSIMGLLSDQDALEITGQYYADEENPTSFENLGLARADAIRQKFASVLDDGRIEMKSKLLAGSSARAQAEKFVAGAFRRMVRNESVREVAGKMVINFPHASADMLENQKLIEYLDDLVARLKQTSERVSLVGHTDSSAGAARNMRLGSMRAQAIKDILVAKGLEASRIDTSSKGETQPIATNNTEEGKQKNRRVELTIIS
ncbi:MAG: OmpA family protein [Saprospiraceae bacterium]|nr:OmpA family protein [Saprospiraceae bacterium]